MNGWITHTEFASTDPDATKTWLAKALGWKFRPSMPMPDGSEYHMFMFSNAGGGGIRPNTPKEVPGTVPYVQVANARRPASRQAPCQPRAIAAQNGTSGTMTEESGWASPAPPRSRRSPAKAV